MSVGECVAVVVGGIVGEVNDIFSDNLIAVNDDVVVGEAVGKLRICFFCV